MEEYNFPFMKFVINRTVSFEKILSYIGIENVDYGSIFCPFHENVNTPAARLYKDDDGDSIYCFAEQRLYRPADAIIKGVINAKIEKVFDRIWSHIDSGMRKALEVEFERPTYKEDNMIAMVNQELGDFKTGGFDYTILKSKLFKINLNTTNHANSTYSTTYNNNANEEETTSTY